MTFLDQFKAQLQECGIEPFIDDDFGDGIYLVSIDTEEIEGRHISTAFIFDEDTGNLKSVETSEFRNTDLEFKVKRKEAQS